MNSIFEQVVSQVSMGVLVVDTDFVVEYANQFMVDNRHGEETTLVGSNLFEVYPELPRKWMESRVNSVVTLGNTSFTSWQQRPHLFKFANSRPITGAADEMYQSCMLFALKQSSSDKPLVCITVSDTTATALMQQKLEKALVRIEREKVHQKKLNRKLEEAQSQLVQSEKLASVGQLAAGVAHEINNPVCFIKANFSALKGYFDDMLEVLEGYSELIDNTDDPRLTEAKKEIYERCDMAFILEEMPDIVTETFDGIQRIEGIVGSLKDFSRVDSDEWAWADLNHGIESTLKIAAHEIKYVVKEVDKRFGDLPRVHCLQAQLNQVFMNLIVNACQAIKADGVIRITTRHDEKNKCVMVIIEDNGCGISEKDQGKIFDPFFTTKDVGKGTGLGLSVSYGIVQAHHGDITVVSKPGVGTRFTVVLPVNPKEGEEPQNDD